MLLRLPPSHLAALFGLPPPPVDPPTPSSSTNVVVSSFVRLFRCESLCHYTLPLLPLTGLNFRPITSLILHVSRNKIESTLRIIFRSKVLLSIVIKVFLLLFSGPLLLPLLPSSLFCFLLSHPFSLGFLPSFAPLYLLHPLPRSLYPIHWRFHLTIPSSPPFLSRGGDSSPCCRCSRNWYDDCSFWNFSVARSASGRDVIPEYTSY
ncbi:unnamed protein product [Linum trigynum]|uniref:Uncharacterized protein n=1 Tax=Linum trigynum TaxID=586398 RepID=A0AAV2EXK3_9ROSI